MDPLTELAGDVTVLKALFNSSSRARKSIHAYLTAAYEMRNKWQKRMTVREFRLLAEKLNQKPFDGRVAKTRERILIELSCTSDSRQKSTYSRAIYNARQDGIKPSGLSAYITKKGGIAKAAYP